MLTPLNQISFTPITRVKTSPASSPLKMAKGLTCDTVSFGNSEFLSKSKKEIFAKIDQSLQNPSENCLGRGGEASVYRIEGTDYCVRIPSKLLQNNLKLTNLSLKVSEKDKINHTVAKLNDGITIMPVIKGVVFGDYDSAELSKIIINMPQSSYNDFLEQLCHAYKHGFEFDATWKNVIINPENNTLTAIDFYRPDGHYRNRLLNEAYHALVGYRLASQECKKVCAGRLYLGALNMMSADRKYTPEISALSPDNFKEFKRDKLIENEKYYQVLNDKFKHLEELKYEQLRRKNAPEVVDAINFQVKVIKSLIKQLFNVV